MDLLCEKMSFQLNEVFGKRCSLTISSKRETRKYTALISKNSIPSELSYRITWFSNDMRPMGHVDMNKRDVYKLLSGKIPIEVKNKIHLYAHLDKDEKFRINENILVEKLSFKDLLKRSDPKRIARANDVSTKSLGVRGTNTGEAWNFSYKSSPSTTGERYRGKIEFNKRDVDKYDNLLDAPCIVDCGCPDFKYRFAFFNNKANITPIGSTAINKNNGQFPKLPDARIGICHHLLGLSEYLRTSIEAPKEPVQTTSPVAQKEPAHKPEIKPATKTTSNAPSPEDSHSLEPKIKEPIVKKEIPPQQPIKKEVPIQKNKQVKPQKNPDKIGDTYSEEEPSELKETTGNSLSQKFDAFVKSHPQFEVKYND